MVLYSFISKSKKTYCANHKGHRQRMKIINHTIALFIIIIVEGYIVLSSELLAIRQTIPYVGSATETVSIVIAAVLMPLAFGYHFGGRFNGRDIFGRSQSIRNKLIFNIAVASLFLFFGLSHLLINSFFVIISQAGIVHNVGQIALYCLAFLVVPVYLLGQTVPLVSNYFSRESLPRVTGKILFFSTVGSFLGAVLSTLGLMATVGVHHTASLNFVLMAILIILLSKRIISKAVIFSVILALLAMMINSDLIMRALKIKSNNQYNTVVTRTFKNGERRIYINNNASSMYNGLTQEKYDYINFAERVLIEPILNANPPKDILIIGSGGFTFGHNDTNNNYTYVDIDKALKDVAEKHILKAPIGDNKTFIPRPARGYLNSTDTKFDLIYIDAFLGGGSVPEHLVTREFFAQVKSHIKPKGIMMSNVIMSPQFSHIVSRNLDNTIRSVFPFVSRHIVGEHYDLWAKKDKHLTANIAYIYKHNPEEDSSAIYTDNKNTIFLDKYKD